MPKRGQKAAVTPIKPKTGGPGQATGAEDVPKLDRRTEPLEPLKKLTVLQSKLWERFINPAWWLNDWDVPKAHSWVVMKAEQIQHPKDMNTARVREIRMFETELGIDSTEQKRRGIDDGVAVDPGEEFF